MNKRIVFNLGSVKTEPYKSTNKNTVGKITFMKSKPIFTTITLNSQL